MISEIGDIENNHEISSDENLKSVVSDLEIPQMTQILTDAS